MDDQRKCGAKSDFQAEREKLVDQIARWVEDNATRPKAELAYMVSPFELSKRAKSWTRRHLLWHLVRQKFRGS